MASGLAGSDLSAFMTFARLPKDRRSTLIFGRSPSLHSHIWQHLGKPFSFCNVSAQWRARAVLKCLNLLRRHKERSKG